MVDLAKRRLFSHLKKHSEQAQAIPRVVPRPPTAVSENVHVYARPSGDKSGSVLNPEEI